MWGRMGMFGRWAHGWQVGSGAPGVAFLHRCRLCHLSGLFTSSQTAVL